MKLVYKGKFSGDVSTLPHAPHEPGAVQFREPQSMKSLAILLNAAAAGIAVVCMAAVVLRGGMNPVSWIVGALLALAAMFPHEILHAVCFKEEVEMYTNFRQGSLFVVGTERMSKARFVFMSLLPNLVFGLLPFLIFLIFPSCSVLGVFGAIGISGGAGDYMNVFNALTQMPRGAKTYMDGFHSYWYLAGGSADNH